MNRLLLPLFAASILLIAAWEAGAHAGTRPVACSGWRVAWGMLRAMCAQRARARRRARARGRNRTP